MRELQKIIKKGQRIVVILCKGVKKMSKLFAVREEVLNNKEDRKKLRDYLKRGEISNFTVVTGFEGSKLLSNAPFLKKGFVYDAANVKHFSERKLATAVSLLLLQEGETSSFFASEAVLLRHLEAIDEKLSQTS